MKQWLSGLWFAPSDLTEAVRVAPRMRGLYVPFWSFSALTHTAYTGLRRNSSSDKEWVEVSGKVLVTIKDILMNASRTLPNTLADDMAPWPLENLKPFQSDYLHGYRAETYYTNLVTGFEAAKAVFEASEAINETIRSDMGGHENSIRSKDTYYEDITFRQLLLPAWQLSYRYAGRDYYVFVNGQTGKVSAERPWSAVKIALAILLGIIVLLGMPIMLGMYGLAILLGTIVLLVGLAGLFVWFYQ